MGIEERLKEVVKQSVKGDVDCFIGYEKGSDALHTRPCLVREAEGVDRLVYGPLCSHNLTRYILESTPGEGKVGVVVKGCDARSLVELLRHNQIRRERLFVVGVACTGQVDLEKVSGLIGSLSPLIVGDYGDRFRILTNDGGRRFRKEKLVFEKCLVCKHPHSFTYDVTLGEMAPPSFAQDDSFEDVKELEALPLKERARYWESHFSECLRCFACRNVCPSCFCPQCISDQNTPRWLSRANRLRENRLYHLIRAAHLAGRCVDCGECERACPAGIPLRKLHRKLAKELRALLGHEGAGLDSEVPAPLATCDPNDPDPFG